VRDPLSHFVAGYTEALVRAGMHDGQSWTVQQVRQFLKALVTGSSVKAGVLGSERYHYMPMSRIATFQPLVRALVPSTTCTRVHPSVQRAFLSPSLVCLCRWPWDIWSTSTTIGRPCRRG
jgi:hypothetical protein